MQFPRRLSAAVALTLFGAACGAAWAEVPHNWQMGFQPAASPVMEAIDWLHNLLLVIITAITILVAALLGYVIWRFSARKNPTPSQTSHHPVLETAWTVLPILILVVIAIPSFRLVYFQDRTHAADLTLKVTAHQWYWEFTYPDHGDLNFSSYMIPDADLKPGQLRLLDVDNQVVLPVGKNIRILVTSADVIHSLWLPALGVQRYAIPGRTIETWVRIDRAGLFSGQCNQICGNNHSKMPIALRAVPEAEFTAWVADAKKTFAHESTVRPTRLAARPAQEAAVLR